MRIVLHRIAALIMIAGLVAAIADYLLAFDGTLNQFYACAAWPGTSAPTRSSGCWAG